MSAIEIGRVARPHGVRGEVRVQLHWGGSDALARVGSIVIELPGAPAREYAVQSARRSGKAMLLKLDRVDDREAAAALQGGKVSVDRASLEPPAHGEFYLLDLIGARVIAPSGEIGEVVEVRVHPTIDSLVIRTPQGKLVEQPLAAPWIDSIDVAEQRVLLSSDEGIVA